MKKSMIEWILDVTTENLSNRRIANKKKSNQYERLKHKIDDKITYCEDCKRVWQKNRKMMPRKWEYYPQNHIPTIGKKRKQCPNCKDANNDSI